MTAESTGIRHQKDIVEHHDELWKAVLTESDCIEKEHKVNKTWHGSSRSAALTGYDSVNAILDVGQYDGTHKVYFIQARWWVRGPEVKVTRYFHNAEDYWEHYILGDKGVTEDRRVVIEGVHYSLGKNGAKPGPHNGHAGRRFEIEFFDGRRVTTHDLWHQGPIPPVFRDRLPDNAKWGQNVTGDD